MSKKDKDKSYKLGWQPKDMNLKLARFMVDLIKSDIKIKRPRKDCKCCGRGYRGFNITTETIQLCHCVLVDPKDIDKIILVFPNRKMKRSWKRPRIERIKKDKYEYDEKNKRFLIRLNFLNK